MSDEKKNKRLDKMELQLTPKQWAIRLADEMRRYPSEKDFLKAIGKGTFRQTPFTKPFFVLAEQAHQRWPDENQEHRYKESELNRKLRMEFQALKVLINNINSAIKIKAEANKLKAELLLSKLQTLILKDSLVHSGVGEKSSASQARLHFLSELEEWADDAAYLLMDTTPYKTAVQSIQESYFETHPILYKENEMALERAILAVRDAIAQFNEYLKIRAKRSNQGSDHEQQNADVANATPFEGESRLTIDIEAVEERTEFLGDVIAQKWVKDAKFTANAGILKETGKHEDFVWGQFRKEMGLEP
jgi:hypothetical protein